MPNTSAQTFKHLLVTAIQHLKQLLTQLEEEQQLLRKAEAEPEDITRISEAKTLVLEKVQQDITARNKFLQQQGVATNEEGVKEFLAKLPKNLGQPLGKGWQQLQNLLEQVQTANSFNGQLINRASQHYEALMNAIKTKNAPAQTKVYSAKGSSGRLSTSRTLGSA